LQEIQKGELLISTGDVERGVEHLANAVVVCGQPTQLLQVNYYCLNQRSTRKKTKLLNL
jgi:hypothetical protein